MILFFFKCAKAIKGDMPRTWNSARSRASYITKFYKMKGIMKINKNNIKWNRNLEMNMVNMTYYFLNQFFLYYNVIAIYLQLIWI